MHFPLSTADQAPPAAALAQSFTSLHSMPQDEAMDDAMTPTSDFPVSDTIPAASRARLCALSDRPSSDELSSLRDQDLQALLHGMMLPRCNSGAKPPIVATLLKWMDHHPTNPIQLPDGMLRSRRSPSGPQSGSPAAPSRPSKPSQPAQHAITQPQIPARRTPL